MRHHVSTDLGPCTPAEISHCVAACIARMLKHILHTPRNDVLCSLLRSLPLISLSAGVGYVQGLFGSRLLKDLHADQPPELDQSQQTPVRACP